MRILIVGGTGFIGSATVASLERDGHQCITVSRSARTTDSQRRLDIETAQDAAAWRDLLVGVDAVINAAGMLREGIGETSTGYLRGIDALYDACERADVRKVIHFSAVGADRAVLSAFSETQHQAEQRLMARDLDWIVLRPSVVVGHSAYGGSALLRGLAALPILPVLPDTAPIQPVHLDDVIATIRFFLRTDSPSRVSIELVGPAPMAFDEAVATFRRWMRWRPARRLHIPRSLAALLYRSGDLVHALGWKTPVNSVAQAEMRRGATGDPEPWQRMTSIVPASLDSKLNGEPASVQERWFARLYLLKPAIFAVFGLFWIATGLVSLGPGYDYGMSYLREGGVPERLGVVTLIAGALADIVIGCAILYRPWSRYGLWAALIISLTYAIIGTWLVPRLWSDPLGPMLKIWPVIMLNLVALAIREDR